MPVTGVILANEFLDALPVHRVVVRGGKLLELFVVWRDRFAEVVAEPSTPELAARLADDDIEPDELAEGQVAGDLPRASSRGWTRSPPGSPAASSSPLITAIPPPSCTARDASPVRCWGIAATASWTTRSPTRA